MKTKVEWITPFEVSIMKAKCPKKYIDMLLETSDQIFKDEALCVRLDASDGLVGNVTNEVHVPQLPAIKNINYWIEDLAIKYARKDFIKKQRLYNDIQKEHFAKEPNAQIVSEWVVRMNPGDFNPAHFHTDCHLSGLLYLKIPEGMERDSGGNLHFLHGSPTTFYTNQYQVAPKVGDTYLWPSWLQHFVYPYKCEGERWVMPFNLVVAYGDDTSII